VRRLVSVILRDTSGAAVVEAAILFPIIFMVIAALVLLAIYMPQRAILQRATQYTATAISTARSDVWIEYDGEGFTTPSKPANVYDSLFKAFVKGDESGVAEKSVKRLERKYTLLNTFENHDYSAQFADNGLTVSYDVLNLVIYKEVIVTATRRIPIPVDLSFVGFPKSLDITVSSTAVVQNGDEFVRNVDIVVDFVQYLDRKYHFGDELDKIFEGMRRVEDFLNI
jgi:hypothetical protein